MSTTTELLEKYDDGLLSLHDLFKQLIAMEDGVRPEEVTDAYILERSEKFVYPTAKLDTGSDFGGYESVGLKFVSHEEFEAIERRVNEQLARVLAESIPIVKHPPKCFPY